MKITRILPRKLSLVWLEYDLHKMEDLYEYHLMMVRGLEGLINQRREEVADLKSERT